MHYKGARFMRYKGASFLRYKGASGDPIKNIFDQKRVKTIFFQNRLLKNILRAWDLSYHSTTCFSTDSPPTPNW